jgi:Retinoic acid induced 16-like protein
VTNFSKFSIDLILKQEDELNREMKTVGECLEYLLKNKVIEALCAYSMLDKPQGFFKFALETLSEMIFSIRSTSILSNSAVHPGIN